MAKTAQIEVAVIGGGPAGSMAAIALASAGVPAVQIGPRAAADNRTTALLGGSVTALEALGIWPLCRDRAAALSTMRIVDDTGRLIRAPEVRFEAQEIGLDAFGYNIANTDLLAAMTARAAALPALSRIEGEAEAVEPAGDRVTIRLAGGELIAAKLAIGADGRKSLCRAAARIETDERRYPQAALTASFTHSRPHRDISTEFHTPSGPFTLVPLPGQRSSLVWVLDPAQAEALAAHDDAALAQEIERKSQSILGKITLEPGRGIFPLTSSIARNFAQNRIALVGESAHVIPPIGAQGLNLGLRDAAAIAELAAEAHAAGGDPGDAGILKRYDDLRRADVGRRVLAVDLLNRSLLTDFLPVQGTRGLGLYLLDRIGPLRRAVMREGVAPADAQQPRLMRGEALL